MVDPLLVVILGPTGSGKTSLSVALGKQFDGEIVSCDSVAVYRGLEIGSAKPSAKQRALVPHYLLDHRTRHRPMIRIIMRGRALLRRLRANPPIR